MLRELTEFILPSRRPPRDCEACGEPFVCGASLAGCWCFSFKLSAETRRQLRERYRDCLCSDCLTTFAGSETAAEGLRANRPSRTDGSSKPEDIF